jgi:hypothetical protein
MFLQLPYMLNLAFLLPMCWSLFVRDNRAGVHLFDGKVGDHSALRLLAGSFWAGLLACSLLGVFVPRLFLPVLMVQFVHAAVFVIVWLAPAAWAGGWHAVPFGLTWRLLGVVVIWPWFIWEGI